MVASQNPPGTPLQRLNGIVWGGAADQRNIYYGLSGGGMVAILPDGKSALVSRNNSSMSR